MINPLRGTVLNDRYYGYDPASYAESFNLKSSVEDTQTDRVISINQALFKTFTLQLSLDNTYNIRVGTSFVGATTWTGVSRLSDIQSYTGAEGASMPLVFITPYGATYNVVPSGALDIKIFNKDNPAQNGVEFRVTLTLEEVT